MTNLLTFEDVRKRSSNGKKPIFFRIDSVSGTIGTRRDHRRAEIDIDLFSGSMDLRDEIAKVLRLEYWEYVKTASPRNWRISKLHSHFGRTSIWFDVRPEHAGEWFRKMITVLSNPASTLQTLPPFPEFYERFSTSLRRARA